MQDKLAKRTTGFVLGATILALLALSVPDLVAAKGDMKPASLGEGNYSARSDEPFINASFEIMGNTKIDHKAGYGYYP